MAHPTRAQIRPYTQASCTPTAERPRPSAMTAPKAPQKPPKAPARATQPRHPMPAPSLPSALAMLAQAQTPADGTTSYSRTGINYVPNYMLNACFIHKQCQALLVLIFYQIEKTAVVCGIYMQRVAVLLHSSIILP